MLYSQYIDTINGNNGNKEVNKYEENEGYKGVSKEQLSEYSCCYGNLKLRVKENSYGKQYAIDNNIPYEIY